MEARQPRPTRLQPASFAGSQMRKLVIALMFVAVSGGLAAPSRLLASNQQMGSTAAPAVQITDGPQIERTTDRWAIIRWTTNNVKGTSLRFGVVRYGTDPRYLVRTAKSPNRWNPGLPYMIYRVQVNNLEPGTTYYYQVEAENARDDREGPQSAVSKFTTERSP